LISEDYESNEDSSITSLGDPLKQTIQPDGLDTPSNAAVPDQTQLLSFRGGDLDNGMVIIKRHRVPSSVKRKTPQQAAAEPCAVMMINRSINQFRHAP
jgi:hypothetical protein